MDNAAWASNIFGALPYHQGLGSGMMLINLSGTCATTKLVQCRDFGIEMCSVTRKFEKRPAEVPDLHEVDFKERKKVVQQISQWVNTKGRRAGNEFVPILYDYETVQGSAKRLKDRGNLVFTDPTTTRFLLVMCFGPKVSSCEHHTSFVEDYRSMTRANAHRFFSLLKYLYHDKQPPVYVRATYTTIGSGLHPEFLRDLSAAPSSDDVPIFHVTDDNLIPSLQKGEIERIDTLLSSNRRKVPPPFIKKAVLGGKSTRAEVRTFAAANIKSVSQCANCGKETLEHMQECKGCKRIRYCSADCQTAAWPLHKKVCTSQPESTPATSSKRARKAARIHSPLRIEAPPRPSGPQVESVKRGFYVTKHIVIVLLLVGFGILYTMAPSVFH